MSASPTIQCCLPRVAIDEVPRPELLRQFVAQTPNASRGTSSGANETSVDRFDNLGSHSTRRPIAVYVGAGDIYGAQLASFLRARGQSVWVRNTSQDPRAAQALRSLLLERGEPASLPLPILDFHVNDMRPISWNADVNQFDASVWSWLRGTLRDTAGETPTRVALPFAAVVRERAAQELRRSLGLVPPPQSPFFGGHGARPLGSALDVLLTSASALTEGVLRIARVGATGVRQVLAGIVTAPFAIGALPFAALETASMLPLDVLVRAYASSHGATAALLAIALALLTLVLLPVNVCMFAIRMGVVRPVLLAVQWVAEKIAGADQTRAPYAAFPAELVCQGRPIGALQRSNLRMPQLADPETWIAHYQQASLSTITLTPPLIRQLAALRASDQAAYAQLRYSLADAGIQCFYRFPSLEILTRTLAVRQTNDGRPVALVVASPSDYNGAFMTLATTLSQLAQGHRLIYVEAIDDAEVAASIARVGNQHPIATLVIAGHGSPNLAQMSAEDSFFGGRNAVDIFDDDRLAPLRHCFARGANIVLEACSTGAIRQHGECLAEMLQRIWPETSVYAPTRPDRNAGLWLNAQGRVVGSASVLGSERHIGSEI